MIFKYKTKTELKRETVIIFNKYITIRSKNDVLTIIQKKQDKKLLLVNNSKDIK